MREPGAATDASGIPVLDPTKNVLDLVDAAIKRQDDLRAAESRHVREVASLRAEYQAELRQAETARLNAIRAVDVSAVQRAAEVQSDAAATLAAQVVASAEAMRVALSAALVPIQADVADLRRAQYEAAGSKTQIVETRGTSAQALQLMVGVLGLLLTVVIIAVAVYAAAH